MTTRPPADGSAPVPDPEPVDGVLPAPAEAEEHQPPVPPSTDPNAPIPTGTAPNPWAPPEPADPFVSPPTDRYAPPPGDPTAAMPQAHDTGAPEQGIPPPAGPAPYPASPSVSFLPSPDSFPAPSGGYPPPAADQLPPGGYPPPYADQPPSGGYPPPAGGPPGPFAPGPPPPYAPPPRGGGRRPLLIAGAVLTAAAVVAGAFLLIGEDEPALQWQGEGIDEAEATLEDAESAVEALVEERHGALHDDGRCYFSLPEDETVKDVNEYLRCGPVLFVDGDPDEPYLTFALSLAGEDDTLVVEDRPTEPEPSALDAGERLERPDGASAPEGNGGLETPEPPEAAEDVLGAIDVGPSTVGTPPEGASIGSLNASYALTALGTIDRYGRGDDARRPAEGHQLIAFDVATGPGEVPSPTATPTVHVQVDGGELRDVGSIIGGSSPVVMSVPTDVESVDLVITDAETEQRLSLLDGTPGDGNIPVLTRTNRTQTLGTAHQVSVTASDATGSATVTGTVTVHAVFLDWFLFDDPSKRPSSPQNAFLVVQLDYAWVGVEPADAGLTNQVFSVALPDGQVLPATNLAGDPTSQAIIAIEVPAGFTTGTLQIGGVDRQPTGLTVDFGANVYSTPISIPEG